MQNSKNFIEILTALEQLFILDEIQLNRSPEKSLEDPSSSLSYFVAKGGSTKLEQIAMDCLNENVY